MEPIKIDDKLFPGKNFKWIKHKGKTLGVWFSTHAEANYADKLAKVSNSLDCLELQRLSLLGKITVLKSLIVSQLVYILWPLPTNQRVLEEMKTLFFNFSWNGKGDKIKQNTMISDYSEGGLRMIDLISFIIIWLYLTRTGNYRIHEFDWLKSILEAV